jgi:hypothetical protein
MIAMKHSIISISMLLVISTAAQSVLGDVSPPPSRFADEPPASIIVPGAERANTEKMEQADFLKSVKEGVQITELGCMRAAFVFSRGSEDLETHVAEQFSKADFRVFPSGVVVEERIEPAALHKIGNDRYADLVVYTKVTSREKNKLGTLVLHEAEATVQVYNPMSQELLISHTERKNGKRHADEVEAVRSAREAAVDAAVKESILATLEKAHKILVHEAQFKGVQDHQHLLEIMEYTARLKGVYHVRQLTYDKTPKLAVIEIIAAPQTESFWRAYLHHLPKKEMLLKKEAAARVLPNENLRKKHPDWSEK